MLRSALGFAGAGAGGRMSADLRRLAAFTALAAFASHHWFLLVEGSAAWRWIACVAIGAAGAGALLMLRDRERPYAAAGTLAAFLAMLIGGLVAIGIPLSSLVPGGWGHLEAQLARGLEGVSQIDTPYNGADTWTRIGILAAVPLAVSLAMLAAFWPGGKGRGGQVLGIGLLILLYGSSVTWEAPSSELTRGAFLFAFLATVLWLPRLRLSRAAAGAATALLAVAVGFSLASRVDASDPLISYADWRIFGSETRINFNWNHTYGDLDWPQEGTEVFVATSDSPLYWKTYVLDEFDGNAWSRASDGFGEVTPEYELAGASPELVEAHPGWVRSFEVEFTGLRSRLAVTSGTIPAVSGLDIGDASGDGTATADAFEIPAGTTYSVQAYVPDPTPRQLRRARGAHPDGAERYTSLLIPQHLSAAEKLIGRPAAGGYAVTPPTGVRRSPSEKDVVEGEEPIESVVRGTPYKRVLRLTRRVVGGARTDYAAVTRIQRFLISEYSYDQDVPRSPDPLPAFLLQERAGYCQQFSGAMALMLRMIGIPARVASGFAPGTSQGEDSYSVSDTDAHSWVEVLYPGIGWVTVDPTPGEAPAQTNVSAPGSASGTSALDLELGLAFANGAEPRRGLRSQELAGSGDAVGDEGSPLPLLAFLVVVATATGIVVRRRRRLRSPEGAQLQLRELCDALRATGHETSPGTTLTAIQSRLRNAVGPDAARYAGGLRDSRYGRRRKRRPGPSERRAFRWELARHSGLWGWWKALRAIPPGGPRA